MPDCARLRPRGHSHFRLLNSGPRTRSTPGSPWWKREAIAASKLLPMESWSMRLKVCSLMSLFALVTPIRRFTGRLLGHWLAASHLLHAATAPSTTSRARDSRRHLRGWSYRALTPRWWRAPGPITTSAHLEWMRTHGFAHGMSWTTRILNAGLTVHDSCQRNFAVDSNCPTAISFAPPVLYPKNLTILVDAYARYVATARESAWSLVLSGSGPLEGILRAQVAAEGLGTRVCFPGFVQYPDLPAFYGLAGAAILPSSSDQWGLVVNEAMAAGLPVLVSSRCGCAPDLVCSAENGHTFEPDSADVLAGLMRRVAGMDKDRLASMGNRSRDLIAAYTPGSLPRA